FLGGPVHRRLVAGPGFLLPAANGVEVFPPAAGGLLAIEAIAIGMASPETVFHEAQANFEVILLLIFMVAGIYFLKNMLLYTFTNDRVKTRAKIAGALPSTFPAAFLSAVLAPHTAK